MSASEALKAARAVGIQLEIDGDDLVLEAASPPPAAVLDAVSRHKAEIVSLLCPTSEGWSAEDLQTVFDERAAIIEYDGCAPRSWAEALARLDPAHPLCDIPPKRWLRFIDDCGRFLDDGWATCAEALGWGPLDLFGCDRERPFARVDHLGLLWLLNGGTVVELHRDRAIIENEHDVRQCYRRRPVEVGRVVLAWELSPKADVSCPALTEDMA